MTTPPPLTLAVAQPEPIGRIIGQHTGVDVVAEPKSGYVRALERMAQSADFDLCEMPLVSVLQAVAVGLPIQVLPVVMLRRAPHLYWVARPEAVPSDLGAVRTGVRSWAQTTGVWLRAVLDDQYGLDPQAWITTDEERYAQLPAPPHVQRVPDAGGVMSLLDEGIVQAVAAPPAGAGPLVPLLTDAAAEANRWVDERGITPVNHVLICSEQAARERREDLLDVTAALRAHALSGGDPRWAAGDDVAAGLPVEGCFDPEQLLRAVDYLTPRAVAQRVLPGPVDLRPLFLD